MNSLPHARGGVSVEIGETVESFQSSPRPWGCFHIAAIAHAFGFVFPTPVGVFLGYEIVVVFKHGLPHARGGVSFG